MDKLLLVDGMNLLFQMYYGIPARILNSRGVPIQGVIGFVGALLKILRMVQPTHVAVLFDGECANPKTALDDQYKANRPDLSDQEETPFDQLPPIYAALSLMGIYHQETTDCEADDWIAAYALTCGKTADVVIASQDSDFFQLINDRVQVLRYRGNNTQLCDREYILLKLGIEPEQYADHKALTGDSADNIRGAEKIGPKTATALLQQFGTLENIIQKAQDIPKPSVRQSVQANAARLRLNQLLIRLDGTAQLPAPLWQLSYEDTGLTTTQILQLTGIR